MSRVSAGFYKWDGDAKSWKFTKQFDVKVTTDALLERIAYHEITHSFNIAHETVPGEQGVLLNGVMFGGTNDDIKLTADQLDKVRGTVLPG